MRSSESVTQTGTVRDAARTSSRGVVIALALILSACAAKTPPASPPALTYAEFIYPAVPANLRTPADVALLDRGWRWLQNDDLTSADRDFAAAIKRTAGFYPARAGRWGLRSAARACFAPRGLLRPFGPAAGAPEIAST